MNVTIVLSAVLLSMNSAEPIDTALLHLDEVTITASHQHTNPISSQNTISVDADYLLSEIPVSLASVDRAVGLVPYCIHRPDLAHEEIPGVRRIRDYALARVWNKRVSK